MSRGVLGDGTPEAAQEIVRLQAGRAPKYLLLIAVLFLGLIALLVA